MHVKLKGLHKVKATLADGTKRVYWYAWKGGPRMRSEHGTPEFVEEWQKHRREALYPPTDTLEWLIVKYKEEAFPKLSAETQGSYAPLLDSLRHTLGKMPCAAIEELGSRRHFERWRDSFKDRPRKASMAWAVARRALSWSVQKERLKRNPCTGYSGYESQSRKEFIWTDTEIDALKVTAPPQIVAALVLAYWTGQRQGDLLRLKWDAYDGIRLKLRQGKTGSYVQVLVSGELREIMDALPRSAVTILTNSRGKPWTSDGFKTSWGKAVKQAGISGKTFHDLRGTFITRARRAGSDIDAICEISGHSKETAKAILETHYLASSTTVSDAVILKMEKKR